MNVYVAEVEGMTRFYRDVLGFTETFRTPAQGVPVHVELRLSGLVVGMAGIDAAWVADPEGNPVELVTRRG